jgi:hypothetical protein
MPVVYCIFEQIEQHLLFFRIIIQQVDRQIRNEIEENRPNFAFSNCYTIKCLFVTNTLIEKGNLGKDQQRKHRFISN